MAIGDGANDVPMIEGRAEWRFGLKLLMPVVAESLSAGAHVGVGVRGREGAAAVWSPTVDLACLLEMPVTHRPGTPKATAGEHLEEWEGAEPMT